jgi:hypothetical protein
LTAVWLMTPAVRAITAGEFEDPPWRVFIAGQGEVCVPGRPLYREWEEPCRSKRRFPEKEQVHSHEQGLDRLHGSEMRSFADPSFFRLIDTLLAEAHTDLRRRKWAHRGVDWLRERHSFTGAACGFAIEQYLVSKPNPNGWSVLVIKEMWWDSNDNSIRSTHWAKPLSGSRQKTLEWLRGEERRIAAQPLTTRAAE